MSNFSIISRILVTTVISCAAAAEIHASTIIENYSGPFTADLNGTLPDQGTALLLNFMVPMESDLTITSSSYASGGFQTNLMLFDTGGHFIAASSPAGFPDPNTSLIGDSALNVSALAGGMYTLAITDYLLNQSLSATNLADGFTANFGNGTSFIDAGGNTRTGAYSVAINVTPVPELPSIVIALALLPPLTIARKWRQLQPSTGSGDA